MWLIVLLLMLLPTLASATGPSTTVINTGSGKTLCSQLRPQTASGSDTCDDEGVTLLPWNGSSRTTNKVTAGASSAAIFGGATTCAFVMIITDAANDGTVRWNYGTADANSPALPAGSIITVNAPTTLDGNGISVIKGSCSSGCIVWGVCQ